ncbi:MAG: hypothetical protein K9L28_09250 [Synergistales bacterium]|nr:hypothetical protein [Synergistales bacterium]
MEYLAVIAGGAVVIGIIMMLARRHDRKMAQSPYGRYRKVDRGYHDDGPDIDLDD